jgi:multidrug efflux pump subunit AcrA (membrane-fusion protein)
MRVRIFGMCLAACAVVACGRGANEGTRARQTPPEAMILGPEDIARVTTGSVITGSIVSGELEAQEQVTVRAQLSGSLTEVNASAGQRVKKGEVLARIRAIAEREAVGSAEAAVGTAQTDLTVAQRDGTGRLCWSKPALSRSVTWSRRAVLLPQLAPESRKQKHGLQPRVSSSAKRSHARPSPELCRMRLSIPAMSSPSERNCSPS